MTTQNNKHSFAEILESSITNFTGQSWSWDTIPEFGSLVTATCNQKTIFGIVYAIKTGPIDPIRQPVPYQKTEEELLKEQPQIFEFLSTSFSCITIAHLEKNQLFFTLPSQPPKMHTFINFATQQEYEKCFSTEQFLYLLYNNKENINLEELLLAIIQQKLKKQILTKERFDKLIQTFFILNKNNYVQTKIFLHRVQQVLQTDLHFYT